MIDKIRAYIDQNGVPGVEFQKTVAPYRKSIQDIDLTSLNPRKASICLLIYPVGSSYNSVLIERSEYEGVHSKQIAFPGGEWESSDLSPWHAAIRETEEEIGIVASEINCISPLTNIFIPPSNFEVHPFIGALNYRPEFKKNDREVSEIIEYPLDTLLDPSILKTTTIKLPSGLHLKTPYFDINSKVVWGATAMVLMEFKEILEGALKI